MQRARLRQPGSQSRPTPYEYNLAMIQPGTSGHVITPVPVEVPPAGLVDARRTSSHTAGFRAKRALTDAPAPRPKGQCGRSTQRYPSCLQAAVLKVSSGACGCRPSVGQAVAVDTGVVRWWTLACETGALDGGVREGRWIVLQIRIPAGLPRPFRRREWARRPCTSQRSP